MKLKLLKKSEDSSNLFLTIFKGVCMGLCASFVLILLFAFVLRFTNIPDSIITPVNQVIKGISIFLGVFLGLRKQKSNGLLKGILIGFCFVLVAFFVFSVLDGTFVFDKTFYSDIIFGSIIGAICGIICVNLKKN